MKYNYPEDMSVNFLKNAGTDTVFLLSSLRDSKTLSTKSFALASSALFNILGYNSLFLAEYASFIVFYAYATPNGAVTQV